MLNRRAMLTTVSRFTLYLRWSVVGVLFAVLALGIVGFVLKWGELCRNPELVFVNYRFITDDIFGILVVYELLDLLRTLSPNRLMDVVLLVLARKIVLAPDSANMFGEVSAFAVLLLVRLLWRRFGEREE